MDVRSATGSLPYRATSVPARTGVIQRSPFTSRSTQKSTLGSLPAATTPSWTAPANRNPLRVASAWNGKINTFRASGRGVSAITSDHRLSHPSTLSAETPKQRDTPLVSADARNSGEMVVPSSDHTVPHWLRSSEYDALYTRYCLKPPGSFW